MFWKKDPIQVLVAPKVTNLALADAWSQFVCYYDSLRAQAEGNWNKTHSLGVLNFFLVQHRELAQRFPNDYGKWEEPLVEAAYVNTREGRSFPPAKETDFLRLDEMESMAACWEELLTSYCRIHGSLQADWRTWNDNEYRELFATIDKLRNALSRFETHRKV